MKNTYYTVYSPSIFCTEIIAPSHYFDRGATILDYLASKIWGVFMPL